MFFVIEGCLRGPYISNKGTPQGSILSPILFNIYLRDIGSILPENVQILQYADDIVIYTSHKDNVQVIKDIQLAIDSIDKYLTNMGLEISSDKSNLIIFNNKKQVGNFYFDKIWIDNKKEIKRVKHTRFLGVILDEKMTGRLHWNYILHKGRKIVDVISSLAGVWWGSHPSTLISIYKAVLRSTIDYGCQIFKYQENSQIALKVKRLQFKAIRVALGYRQSTPINTMLYEANEPPIDIRGAFLSLRYIYRNLAREFNPVIESLDRLLSTAIIYDKKTRIVKKYSIIKNYILCRYEKKHIFSSICNPAFDTHFDNTIFRPEICDDLTNVDKNAKHHQIKEALDNIVHSRPEHTNTLYTDGSKSIEDKFVGAAIYSPFHNRSVRHKLPYDTSIFSAEAWAILQAVDIACSLDWKYTLIFSDSLSVLNSLKNIKKTPNNYLIHWIKHKMARAAHNNQKIELIWIPAHRGLDGNEKADQAAKEASKIGYKPNFKIPFEDFFHIANDHQKRRFHAYLEEEGRIKGIKHFNLYQKTKMGSKP